MIKLIVPLFLLVAFPCCGQDQLRGRPMDQMQGDCNQFATNLKSEMRLMAQPPVMIQAAASAQNAAQLLPFQSSAVSLQPQLNVIFLLPPEKKRGGADTYAGLVSLGTLRKGLWHVSADGGIWLDLITSGKMVASPSFEMQTGCKILFKTVAFDVPGNSPLLLQISGSKSPVVKLLLTPVAP
jgi:hypothetical protein